MTTQHIFNVQLIVKGQDRDQAYSELALRLNEWFMADNNQNQEGVGYPDGSLLFWGSLEQA